MTRLPHPARLAATAVAAPLLALSLVACGGGADGAGAPDDASSEDFCEAFNNAPEDDDADAAQEWADDLAEVGTPSSVEGEAREGYERFVDALSDFEDGDDSEDLEEVFGDDADKVEAFITQAAQDCTPGLEDLEGELPEPSDLPS